jgi:hypothetical protein
MYTLELGGERKPRICSCCGGKIKFAVGFIYKDGDAFSIYQSSWSDSHQDVGIDALFHFAKDADFENKEQVYTIGIRIRTTEDQYQFSFIDPEKASWGESQLSGRMLNREEALLHPQKSEFFRVAEFIIGNDPRLQTVLS